MPITSQKIKTEKNGDTDFNVKYSGISLYIQNIKEPRSFVNGVQYVKLIIFQEKMIYSGNGMPFRAEILYILRYTDIL